MAHIFTIENGRLRFVGVRPYGEDAWELMPEGGYFAPGPDDGVGDRFTTIPDDYGRPPHSVVDVLDVHKLEFGIPEAFWVIRVKDFDAVVTMDSHGDSLHKTIEDLSSTHLDELIKEIAQG